MHHSSMATLAVEPIGLRPVNKEQSSSMMNLNSLDEHNILMNYSF